MGAVQLPSERLKVGWARNAAVASPSSWAVVARGMARPGSARWQGMRRLRRLARRPDHQGYSQCLVTVLAGTGPFPAAASLFGDMNTTTRRPAPLMIKSVGRTE
jgi:hypothetical protein